MRLKLTFARGGFDPVDLVVTADAGVTVGAVAAALAHRDPRSPAPPPEASLRVGDRTLPADVQLSDAGIRSGSTVSVVAAPERYVDDPAADAAARLDVVAGPDAGTSFPLRSGNNQLGRGSGNDVRLNDPQVSRAHARFTVTDAIEVTDLASSNGVRLDGERVSRAVLQSGQHLVLGDTELVVVHTGAATRVDPGGSGELFNRSPKLDVRYEGVKHVAPEPPGPPERARMSFIPLLAPVLLGAVLFAVTRQLVTVLFVAFSPLLMLGGVLERRISVKKEHAEAVATFRDNLQAFRARVAQECVVEAAARRDEHPPTSSLMEEAHHRDRVLWSARPDRRGFLELRLGVGGLRSRSTVELPTRPSADGELWSELLEVRDLAGHVDDVPVVVSLREVGSVGVAGPRHEALEVTRALIAQLVTLHSPAELVLTAAVPPDAVAEWAWLTWLPHAGSDHSPLHGDHLASGEQAAEQLTARLDELIEARTPRSGDTGPPPLPAVVLLVDDAVPIERSRLVELAERGPAVGVHLVWLAPALARLPAACRAYAELSPSTPGRGVAGHVARGEKVADVQLEHLQRAAAEELARSLSPVVDAGARLDDQSDLPPSASLLALLGKDLAESAEAVVDRWRTDGSLPGPPGRDVPSTGLRAVVGDLGGQSFSLDLREHGPHALVGGTTGSGKSEFLQTWVMAMAVEHSPNRVNFLFVDYKGESAFGECVKLPHCVGLVSDLSPRLVRRALTSLGAELRLREEVLREHGAKDMLQLEKRGDGSGLPSLVIVIDEFAALVSEVPEFIDGVVDVAQRGRSLGLHLILATQRPAGVIKENLRANTNLRIALRVADEDDSTNVLGTPAAATFDPALPGRAMAKTGPGRMTAFQTGYVGGVTSDEAPPPVIVVVEQPFGTGATWKETESEQRRAPRKAAGPGDLSRLVRTIRAASKSARVPVPRRPWQDEMEPTYDVTDRVAPPSDTDTRLVFGLQDNPKRQRQDPVAFFPDRDGTMAVYGTGGSGKSAFLRTLAVAAGLALREGPCHVYALDFGARGLAMLEAFDHVGAVVNGDDDERVARLLRMLRATVDERAARYAEVNAGTVTDYRTRAGRPDEPRILLLVDGVGAFRTAYEAPALAKWFEMFQSIAADGRQVGVHVVVSADRAGALPAGLSALVQRRLALRMGGDAHEGAQLRVPPGGFSLDTPPGRGFLDGDEVQVSVLSGSPSTGRQAKAIRALAAELRRAGPRPAPRPVGRLPERVGLGELPREVDGLPVIGVSDDTLEAQTFVPEGVMVISGPPGSGRSTVLATMAMSIQRWRPDSDRIYLGPAQSPVNDLEHWTDRANEAEDIAVLAKRLTTALGGRAKAPPRPLLVVVEELPSFAGGPADDALMGLLKAVRSKGGLMVVEGELSTVIPSYQPLVMEVKAARHGVVLQPDQNDGEALFKTPLPRINRATFPQGRGFYVAGGRALRMHCALPDDEPV